MRKPLPSGPWHIEDFGKDIGIYDSNGRLLALIGGQDRFGDEESLGLAIAALPQLLEAAESVVNDVDDWGEMLQFHYLLIDILKAAVIRARG